MSRAADKRARDEARRKERAERDRADYLARVAEKEHRRIRSIEEARRLIEERARLEAESERLRAVIRLRADQRDAGAYARGRGATREAPYTDPEAIAAWTSGWDDADRWARAAEASKARAESERVRRIVDAPVGAELWLDGERCAVHTPDGWAYVDGRSLGEGELPDLATRHRYDVRTPGRSGGGGAALWLLLAGAIGAGR